MKLIEAGWNRYKASNVHADLDRWISVWEWEEIVLDPDFKMTDWIVPNQHINRVRRLVLSYLLETIKLGFSGTPVWNTCN